MLRPGCPTAPTLLSPHPLCHPLPVQLSLRRDVPKENLAKGILLAFRTGSCHSGAGRARAGWEPTRATSGAAFRALEPLSCTPHGDGLQRHRAHTQHAGKRQLRASLCPEGAATFHRATGAHQLCPHLCHNTTQLLGSTVGNSTNSTHPMPSCRIPRPPVVPVQDGAQGQSVAGAGAGATQPCCGAGAVLWVRSWRSRWVLRLKLLPHWVQM